MRCRDRLTGDWCGYRSCLRENGIAYRGRVTQFFFGVGGGVNPPVPDQFAALGIAGGDTFEYTGNSRHDFLVSLDKFGGLPHSRFVVTLENIWGRWGNVSFETGGLSPAVFNALMPVDPEAHGDVRTTNFMLLQPLSERFIVTVGKLRTIGVADNNIFAGGDGSDQFVNQTFVANPLMVPQIPLSTFVVGAVMPQDWGHVGLTVLDPSERSREFMEFDTLYSRGAIVMGQVQVDTNFFDKPGEHHVGGFYKNVDLLDLSFTPLPPEYPYPPAPPEHDIPYSSGNLHDLLRFRSIRGHLRQPRLAGQPGRLGVLRTGQYRRRCYGESQLGRMARQRRDRRHQSTAHRRGTGDRFGIGYAYTATSTEFGAIPRFLFDPRDAQIIEAYYRYRLTPAIEITPDVQWINGMLGGLTDGDGAIVAGMRLNMKL